MEIIRADPEFLSFFKEFVPVTAILLKIVSPGKMVRVNSSRILSLCHNQVLNRLFGVFFSSLDDVSDGSGIEVCGRWTAEIDDLRNQFNGIIDLTLAL